MMRNTLEKIVSTDEIVDFLKSTLQFKTVSHNILSKRIIREHADLASLSITDSEVQAEVDRFRRDMGLEKAADTFAWIESEGITPEDWEVGIRERLLSQKLRHHLFDKDAEKAFHQSRVHYERVKLYQLIVSSDAFAQELFYQIEDQEISFFDAAHLYDISEERRDRCGYEGLLPRSALPPVLGAAVFGAEAGNIIPPVATDEGYHLLLPQRFIGAELTDDIREELLEQMFQEWLTREINHCIQQSAEVKVSRV